MGLTVVMFILLALIIAGAALGIQAEIRDHRAKTRKEIIAVASLLRDEIRKNKS